MTQPQSRHNTLTLDLDAGILQRHLTFQQWTAHAPTRCDQCAADLPSLYGHGILYGEQVNTCSASCFVRLHRIWAPVPSHRRLVRTLMALAASVLLWLGR